MLDVEPILAGFWASIGSSLGKFSGHEKVADTGIILYIVVIILMVTANTWGCRYYVRSLDAADNSVLPTVISAACNYIISGLIGILCFDESWTWRWWLGASLVISGLGLLSHKPPTIKTDSEEE